MRETLHAATMEAQICVAGTVAVESLVRSRWSAAVSRLVELPRGFAVRPMLRLGGLDSVALLAAKQIHPSAANMVAAARWAPLAMELSTELHTACDSHID